MGAPCVESCRAHCGVVSDAFCATTANAQSMYPADAEKKNCTAHAA